MYQKINPTTKCLHPKTIYRNGKRLVVACGKCNACMLRKSNTATTSVTQFSNDYPYCHFVTLTYAPEYLPMMRVQRIDYNDANDPCYHLIDMRHRDGTSGNLVSTELPDNIQTIIDKNNLGNDCIGVLSRLDVKNFIKRLRINLNRHTQYDEKELKYYAVGEYGPKSLRPHYHLLFWHTSYWSTADLWKIICKSWPFGRIDCQLSRGHAAEYCVSYLNSYSCLPRFYGLRSLSPFSLHSKGLYNTQVTSELRKKVFQERFTDELRFNYREDGEIKSALLPLQVVARILPRIPYFSSVSYRTKCAVYRLLQKLPPIKDGRSYFQIAGDIAKYFYDRQYRKIDDVNPTYDSILSILAELPSWQNQQDKWREGYLNETIDGLKPCLSLFNFIYNIFRISNIALCICEECQVSIETLVSTIDEYYSKRDMQHLNDMYYTIEDLPKTKQYAYYTDTLLLADALLIDDYIARLRVDSSLKVSSRIKHKVINDINKILFDDD